MINEKIKFLTVSWLSGLLSAEIFISTGEWGSRCQHWPTKTVNFCGQAHRRPSLGLWVRASGGFPGNVIGWRASDCVNAPTRLLRIQINMGKYRAIANVTSVANMT